MTWNDEATLPFVPVGEVYFSPVFGGDIVYIIDNSAANFWRYSISSKTWTHLAAPGLAGEWAIRTLVPDDETNPTRLFTASEEGVDVAYPNDHLGDAIRISTYNIATNVWTHGAECPPYLIRMNHGAVVGGPFLADEIVTGVTSGATGYIRTVGGGLLDVVQITTLRFDQAEDIIGTDSGATATLDGAGASFGPAAPWRYCYERINIRSMVYEDATHLYVWVTRYPHGAGAANRYDCRVLSYNPVADDWEALSANDYAPGTSVLWDQFQRCAAINPAGTVLYCGVGNGAVLPTGRYYVTYTIGTDTYLPVATGGGGFYNDFWFVASRHKLWFGVAGGAGAPVGAFGFIDTVDDSLNEAYFPSDAGADNEMPRRWGNGENPLGDPINMISFASVTAPEIRKYGSFLPLAQTDPATGVT